MKPVYNSLLILYETGIRHSELNRESLVILPDQTIKVISKKKSENRIIDPLTLSDKCLNLLYSFTNNDVILSRSVLYDYFLRSCYPYRIVKSGNQVVLHSFRYNFIKKLYTLYNDYVIVQSIIGHKDLSHTIMYINSTLQVLPVIYLPAFLVGQLDLIQSTVITFD